MKETELKPCPFCGSEAKLKTSKRCIATDFYRVKYLVCVATEIKCTECGMSCGETMTDFVYDYSENHKDIYLKESLFETETVRKVRERWNRRADNEQREAD